MERVFFSIWSNLNVQLEDRHLLHIEASIFPPIPSSWYYLQIRIQTWLRQTPSDGNRTCGGQTGCKRQSSNVEDNTDVIKAFLGFSVRVLILFCSMLLCTCCLKETIKLEDEVKLLVSQTIFRAVQLCPSTQGHTTEMGSGCSNSNKAPKQELFVLLLLIRTFLMLLSSRKHCHTQELSHITLSDTSNDSSQDQLQNLPQNYFNMTHKFFYI